MLQNSPTGLPPKKVTTKSPESEFRCLQCCQRLDTLSADLRCVHLELRRMHVTLTNQLHALKEAALRPRRRSIGGPNSGDPVPGVAPLALARSLEESVGCELRQIRGAVLRLREDVRDYVFARNGVIFPHSASLFAIDKRFKQNSLVGSRMWVHQEVQETVNHSKKANFSLTRKNSLPAGSLPNRFQNGRVLPHYATQRRLRHNSLPDSASSNGESGSQAERTGGIVVGKSASSPESSSHGVPIEQHYTGNKWRNAQVREDIPRARDEQQREVEEAAIMHALHERMLQRQEEIDKQLAQQIAEKIDREEWTHRRAIEERDKEIAQQLQPSSSLESVELSEEMDDIEDKFSQEREKIRLDRLRDERERVQLVQGANGPLVIPESSPDADSPHRPYPPPMHQQHMIHQQHSSPVQRAIHYSPKGVPSHSNHIVYTDEDIASELGAMDLGPGTRRHGNYPHREEMNAEFYHTGSSTGEDEHLEFSLNNVVVVESEDAKRIQEEQDAELARLLQEQEGKRGGGNFGMDPLDRDRLLAVEAQDRELARMLQERERAKARRARERGKQRALLKKQQQREQQMLEGTSVDGNEDDDEPEYGTVVSNGTDNEGDDHQRATPEQRSPPSHGPSGSVGRADRPTDLDLSGSKGRRSSTGAKAKPRQRYPDPEAIEVLPQVGMSDSPSIGSSRCANIAMAIDPTYPRRAHPASPPSSAVSSLSRGSSPAVGTGICSGSASSSPGISLPPPDFEEDDSPAPPYMPIQGQRRTSSLEKKGKKGKQKDGCRQQ